MHVLESPARPPSESDVPWRDVEHQPISSEGFIVSGYLSKFDDDDRDRGGDGIRSTE